MEKYINQLKQVLAKTGWSQTQLSQEIGVTFATVNRWLNSHTKPHPAQRYQIDRLFKNTVGMVPLLQSTIQSVIKGVMAKKQQFKGFHFLHTKEIADELLLELTYNSDAMEGSTLTKKETEAVIFHKATIDGRSLVEHMETHNHAAILRDVFEGKFNSDISEDLIKKLHKTLMHGIREDAGEYAKRQRVVQGRDLILPHPSDIPREMELFCDKVNHYQGHSIEHIARMHADFEAIHPFEDGNGRIGRLIMTIQLANNGFAPAIISVEEKGKYYEFLEYAQKRSETHFVRFLAEAILKGYEIVARIPETQ